MPDTLARIEYDPDQENFEFTPPGEEASFEPNEVPDEGSMIFEDPDTGKTFLVTLQNYEGGDLEPNTCYELVKVETEVSFSDDDEEEEEVAPDPTLAHPEKET